MSTLGKIQDLRQQITYNAAEHGDHVWLVSPETDLEITFREAAERVELIAANLKAFG